MMVSGYLLQNWDSRQDLVSPGLGVTNLTSEKWRGEELGSESSLRAGEGKGMRIVRGWHGTTFYLAHQSNINELMTSQGGTHQYLATLRSGHNLVSDVRINSSGGECCHQPFRVQSKLWGNRKNKLLLITVNMWQWLTQLSAKRKILKKEEKLHLTIRFYIESISPQFPRYSNSVIPALVNILQARQTHGLLSPSLVANQ